MALEALNDVGYSNTKMTVILNDNEMSISKNMGGLNMFLSKLRTKKLYKKSSISLKKMLLKVPIVGKPSVKVIQRAKRSIKQLIIPTMFFEDIGFIYLGPVDGHNIEELENILRLSKQLDKPVLVHVLTKKGKGYKIAEENPDRFHATAPFDIKTGKAKKQKSDDYSKVFGEKLVELAKENPNIVAVTASMKDGTGLTKFAKEFPDRFFDVGIAEQHAVTMAAGMAKEGMIPVVPIYSSFYQRAYDQVIHDVAMQNLPVIMAPKDFEEFRKMLEFAVNLGKPVVIRYPRGGEEKSIKFENHPKIELGKAEIVKEGENLTIIAIGKRVAKALELAEKIEKQHENLTVEVINARFLKPLDKETIKQSIVKTKKVITMEDGTEINGLGTAVEELIVEEKLQGIELEKQAWPDEFIKHGTVEQLEKIFVPEGRFLWDIFVPWGQIFIKGIVF